MANNKGYYGYSDNGFEDAVEMIKQSWTYGRLTTTEKLNLIDLLNVIRKSIKELDYQASWDLVSDIHSSFIEACGYVNGDGDWRNPDDEEKRTIVQNYKTAFGRVEIVEVRKASCKQ